MAMNPEIQRKAQVELDTVVGTHRLPEPIDLENLVFLRAILLETLRWKPVAPFSIPHRVIQDDTYNGFHIPKGTVMLPVSVAVKQIP